MGAKLSCLTTKSAVLQMVVHLRVCVFLQCFAFICSATDLYSSDF